MELHRNEHDLPGQTPAGGPGPGPGPHDRFADRSPDRYPAERMRSVYALTEYNGRTQYTRIGIGFVNRDESITLKLNALPTSGTMQIREYQRYEDGDRKGDMPPRTEPGPAGRGARAGIPF